MAGSAEPVSSPSPQLPRQQSTDAAAIWGVLLESVQREVSRPNFDTWFRDTAGLWVDGNELVVAVPNHYVADCIQKQYHHLLRRHLPKVNDAPVLIRYEVAGTTPTYIQQHIEDDPPVPYVVGAVVDVEKARRKQLRARLLAIGFNGITAFLDSSDIDLIDECLEEVEAGKEVVRRGEARAPRSWGAVLRRAVEKRMLELEPATPKLRVVGGTN